MERNSSTKNRSSSKYTIESDGWGNLMIHSTDEPEARSRDRPDCADLSVPLEKHTEPLTKSQFANFCTESYDGTRKLSINGGDIFKNIGYVQLRQPERILTEPDRSRILFLNRM